MCKLWVVNKYINRESSKSVQVKTRLFINSALQERVFKPPQTACVLLDCERHQNKHWDLKFHQQLKKRIFTFKIAFSVNAKPYVNGKHLHYSCDKCQVATREAQKGLTIEEKSETTQAYKLYYTSCNIWQTGRSEIFGSYTTLSYNLYNLSRFEVK